MRTLETNDVETAIFTIYQDAYKAFRDGRLKENPRLDPEVGELGRLWSLFDSLAERKED